MIRGARTCLDRAVWRSSSPLRGVGCPQQTPAERAGGCIGLDHRGSRRRGVRLNCRSASAPPEGGAVLFHRIEGRDRARSGLPADHRRRGPPGAWFAPRSIGASTPPPAVRSGAADAPTTMPRVVPGGPTAPTGTGSGRGPRPAPCLRIGAGNRPGPGASPGGSGAVSLGVAKARDRRAGGVVGPIGQDCRSIAGIARRGR